MGQWHWRIGSTWLAAITSALLVGVVVFAVAAALVGADDAIRFFTLGPAVVAGLETWRSRSELPAGRALEVGARLTILRSVRDGDDVGDDALAPAAAQWANACRYHADRTVRHRIAIALVSAWVALAVVAHAVEARTWWLVVASAVVGGAAIWFLATRMPSRLARRSARAWRAEGFAQRRIWREHRV